MAGLQSLDRLRATMGRAVVDNPEAPSSLVVGRLRHHLIDKSVERRDAAFELTASEDPGAMNIQRRQVGPGAAALVFMFHPQRPAGLAGQARMLAPARLDAGLFSSGEMTKSSSLRGRPRHWRWYRSKMRPALAAKSGSRGKIQLRWRHGRMAS